MANARRNATAQWRSQVALVPTGNPLVFTTPEPFLHVPPGASIALYYNGQRLESGLGNDFTVSESGGPATGYDTVTLLFSPHVGDKFRADYFVP